MDYKDTLNLPRTKFPMKANLSQKEPETLKEWGKLQIYKKIKELTQDRKQYILHDGPPYANGHIHIGTALNKILKDIIIKSKTMDGFNCNYVPGWDCHGLPIEHEVDKKLGEKRHSIPVSLIRKRCREYAEKFIDIQRNEFKRLGVFGDWENPYLTMNHSYVATIVREFGNFVKTDSVYKSKKPIHWCASCKTALAEAEVEYKQCTSPSIYVEFPFLSEITDLIPSLKGEKVSVIIWTTTPWTIPANLAITFHPDFSYVAIKAQNKVFIVAEGLLENTMKAVGIKEYEVIERFSPLKLEGLKCKHPFIDRESLIILGNHVTLEAGTGCVHTAPGHGQEDYEIGLKYSLDIYTPVDDNGRFTDDIEFFAGQFVFDANESVNKKLNEVGCLLSEESITHSYPHCWRCKNPIVFRSTEQWFISMEKNRLRENALENINRVNWIPKWGRDRIYSMIENRPDWCISRQRAWGVPIIIFYCKACNYTLAKKEVIDFISDQFEKEGCDIWFSKKAEELLPPGTQCPKCNHNDFNKEMDILDVWFDSGVSYAAVLERREDLKFPADIYLEGSDQHRGWFHSSLLTSVNTRSTTPYRAVLTHGFVVDGQGKKMSKSSGNVIAPDEIIKKYGAEILRLWVAAEDYKDDIRISDEILKRMSEAYRRIRNTCRYILGNLYDFDPSKDALKYEDLIEIDRFSLHILQKLIKKIKDAYDDFSFHVVYHSLHNFCVVDMSAFYLDVLKDRLYISKQTSKERRSAQTAMYEILNAIVRLMAPILSFTSEEVWRHLPFDGDKTESIHLTEFPPMKKEYTDQNLEDRWNRLLKIRGEVFKALEIARQDKVIGHSLDALVEIFATEEILDFLKSYEHELKSIFIVSKVNLLKMEEGRAQYTSEEIDGLKIKVNQAPGNKCERCWTYSKGIGDNEEHPNICPRCSEVLIEP
ncbi:MAG: isoleucine--tRNA ligase [Thermodesulfobacteriota bacterium]|nr:isoleucine--tRNA ligase [Thermodesulfobacteriota bacterium]